MSQYFVEQYNDGISLLQNKAYNMGLLPFHFLQSCFTLYIVVVHHLAVKDWGVLVTLLGGRATWTPKFMNTITRVEFQMDTLGIQHCAKVLGWCEKML